MGAGKGQLHDLLFLVHELCELPVGPFLQPVKILLNGSITTQDALSDLIFLLGPLPLLPHFVYFLLMSELSGAPCTSVQAPYHYCFVSRRWRWIVLELGGHDP